MLLARFNCNIFRKFASRIPKGFRLKAQGCELASYPGKDEEGKTTPKGLRPNGGDHNNQRAEPRPRNPVGKRRKRA